MSRRASAGLLVTIVLAATAVPVATGHRGSNISPCKAEVGAAKFSRFSAQVWNVERWKRGKPPAQVVAYSFLFRQCATSSSARQKMKAAWAQDRRRFGRYRLYRRVARHPAHAYGVCDAEHPRPADKCYWSIPAYIVCGESGFDFYVNGDGAYQIIESTWDHAGGGRFADTAGGATPLEQHLIAAKLWGSTAWYGAC